MKVTSKVLSVLGVFLAVGCGDNKSSQSAAPSSIMGNCESLQGEYAMDEKSCVGYYTTLLPRIGNAFGWVGIEKGDTLVVKQASCQSIVMSNAKAPETLVDLSIGEKKTDIKNYKGKSSRQLFTGVLVYNDSAHDYSSGAKREFKFKLNSDKNLVVEMNSSSFSFPFPKTQLKSVCTLKRIPSAR